MVVLGVVLFVAVPGVALLALVVLMVLSRRRRKVSAARVPLSIETIDRTFVRVSVARARAEWLLGLRRPVLMACVAGTGVLVAAGLLLPGLSDVGLALSTVLVCAALVVVLGAPLLYMVAEYHASLLTTQELFAAELRQRLEPEG